MLSNALNGVVPVVDLGRTQALIGVEPAVNTRARLEPASAAGVISPSGVRDLIEAYDLIAGTRLEHQARRVKTGLRRATLCSFASWKPVSEGLMAIDQHGGPVRAGMDRKPRIPVVKDKDTIADALDDLRTREGYDHDRLASGAGALPRIRSTYPDLVLRDVMLPEVSGYEICEGIGTAPRSRTSK